jgi:hypothetical protein
VNVDVVTETLSDRITLPRTAVLVDTRRPLSGRWWDLLPRFSPFEAALALTAAIVEALSVTDRVLELLIAGPEVYRFVSAGRVGYFEDVLDILSGIESCREDTLDKLEPLLFEEIRLIQSVCLVLTGWDARRAALKTEMASLQRTLGRQQKALGGYYACVRYVDAQVGKVLAALEATGAMDDTVIVFTSDHGFHLGEHDFWAKVSLRDESARVPLIIAAPGRPAAVSDALVELQDLFPTTAALCGLPVPERVHGADLSPLLEDPSRAVRDFAFSVAPMRAATSRRTPWPGTWSGFASTRSTPAR